MQVAEQGEIPSPTVKSRLRFEVRMKEDGVFCAFICPVDFFTGLSFFFMCIRARFFLAIPIAERKNIMSNTKFSPKYIAVVAMFTALAFVSVVIAKVIPNVAGFLSYEPKDSVIAIAGFIFGPLSSVLISILVSLIEMLTISTTGPIGFAMNVIATCAFVLPATVIYKKNRTRKGALVGLFLGMICMTVCMILWNYILTPLYMKVDRSTVVNMLVPVFLPFNLIKGGINAGITLLLYKPIVTALRKARLVEPSKESTGKAGFNLGFFLVSLAVLVTFVVAFLGLIGVI